MADKQRDLDALAAGVRAGTRADLGRAITLVESHRPEDRDDADALLALLGSGPTSTQRVGVTGAPGVGKSMLIEALGTSLVRRGCKVAVLAVDPSSTRSGGSILGDKTRMARLAREHNAFIRPSPSGGALGGVARRTRETIAVCEAAGYDTVLVETVGVGQSEILVSGMVDFFLVLAHAGGGDELQGIKRGILELADLVAITKSDGDNCARAEATRHEYARALELVAPRHDAWSPSVLTCSALTGDGIDDIWSAVLRHRQALEDASLWDEQRREQRVRWLRQAVDDGLANALRRHVEAQRVYAEVEVRVRSGQLSADAAAAMVLRAFDGSNAPT